MNEQYKQPESSRALRKKMFSEKSKKLGKLRGNVKFLNIKQSNKRNIQMRKIAL